ncbi:hypothetical protein D5S17_29200 [Pseudonocardiaceae bacterium YIM PH 21723]|nr:hypothetical protein D5S17_29200 [Pseudonocardiaceae bacterium YIM PH 21723]
MRRTLPLVAVAAMTLGLATVVTQDPLHILPAAAAADRTLLADSNRDGVADDKDASTDQEALFLPNLDDSSRRCVVTQADLTASGTATDTRLAACNDAADEIVNGAEDLKDLAPLRLRPAEATGAGQIKADTDKVRLFVQRAGNWVSLGSGGVLTQQELKDGVELRLEGKDLLRNKAVWNGQATVTVTRPGGVTESVKLRVAPALLQNDLRAPNTVVTSKGGSASGYSAFLRDLQAAGANAQAWHGDTWAQDTAEPATASVPGPGGTPRVMRVVIRSGNYDTRQRGREWFQQRGPGLAVVQHSPNQQTAGEDTSLNSTGNTEGLPPYPGHPNGRPLWGGASRQMDANFQSLLSAQYDSAPIKIDTDWLGVGHTDETLHVIPSKNKLGWTFMVADPRLAVKLLRTADQNARLYSDTSTPGQTVREALADSTFLADNEEAAGHIDKQIAVLLRETGLTDADLVRVPVLWESESGFGIAAAANPRDHFIPTPGVSRMAGKYFGAASASIPNGISLGGGVLALPKPHAVGDVFEKATTDALKGYPVTVRWVEDWDYLHRNRGEVHCGTNALREPTNAAWWK